ncbi:STAS domain-containing protein [Actinopolyspora mortivallis]|uniref:STAS domain-containing protein n=1 Tax=Actinopolyspora mortivallis TaxID=33906 RepID=UPI0003685DE1|nr:STAS domain-containing protein [Actinopolyspora mortivallis]
MIAYRTNTRTVVDPPRPNTPTGGVARPRTDSDPHRLNPLLRMAIQRPEPGVAVIDMDGEIDLSTAPRITELIRQRLTAAVLHTLIIDLSRVSFVSSVGVELLLRAQHRAQRRGIELHVVPGARCVRRLLEITGIDQGLNCHDSLEAALARTHR